MALVANVCSVGGLKKGFRVGESMTDFDYEALLDRAHEKIPKDISERSRWSLPEPDVLIEGNQTILRNFSEMVAMMDRDANHVYQFLQNELGTSGSREANRILLKGRIPPKRIKERIVVYVKTYILCHQCNSPDTSFIKADRTTQLKCQACGGSRPVKL
jgi:translation initiation factor 2 subunit 2